MLNPDGSRGGSAGGGSESRALVSRTLQASLASRLQFADVARYVGISTTPPRRHAAAASADPRRSTQTAGTPSASSAGSRPPPRARRGSPPLGQAARSGEALRSSSSPSLPRGAAASPTGWPAAQGCRQARPAEAELPRAASTGGGRLVRAREDAALSSAPAASGAGGRGSLAPAGLARPHSSPQLTAAPPSAWHSGVREAPQHTAVARHNFDALSYIAHGLDLAANRARAEDLLRWEHEAEDLLGDLPLGPALDGEAGASEDQDDAVIVKRRMSARNALLDQAGSAVKAFQMLDLNSSKTISRTEFTAGMWQTLGKDVVKSFVALDKNEDGVLDMAELFPRGASCRAAVSTPDFWGKWCRQNDKLIRQGERLAKWHAEDPDEEITRMLKRVEEQDQSASERRRMKMWIRHLKAEGASDAMIRRLCASHLPKVPRFTKEHAHKLRLRYNAKVTDSVRKVQDTVKDMREMRHTVSKFKESLSEVVDGERRKPRRDSAETSIGVFVAETDELSSVPERRSSSAKGATPQKDASSKKHASRTRREKAEKEKAQREEVYNAVREGLGDDFEVSARRAAATGNFDL